jgi:hypothetical protein
VLVNATLAHGLDLDDGREAARFAPTGSVADPTNLAGADPRRLFS